MSSPHDAIETKVLIISDTHGERLPAASFPSHESIDVVIHCGDLTEESKLAEHAATIKFLQDIDAPLKLVIAGNHDFTLDTPAFQRILKSSGLLSEDNEDVVHREYGQYGEAMGMYTDAEGITFLNEGTHHFDLANGSKLAVYASPFTPSNTADWGFQYIPQPVQDASPASYPYDGHAWEISNTVDIAITHSPPFGLLDRANGAVRRGSHGLFAAIEKARPKVHCFGHVHQGWGAKLVAWRNPISITAIGSNHAPGQTAPASHLTHIDNDRSQLVESLATLTPGRFDSEDAAKEKQSKLQGYRDIGVCEASCDDERGSKTLFVNAAIQGQGDGPDGFHLPWIVNLKLPRAG